MSLFEAKKQPLNTQKKFIKELKVGDKVEFYSKISSVVKKNKKDGGAFLSLELMDKTGKITSKIWDNADYYFKMIREGGIYKISGVVTEYLSQKEIKIDVLKEISSGDTGFNETDFVEKPVFDNGGLFNEMMETMRSNLTDTYLLQLVELFEKEHGEKFKDHYGAQKIHHSYIGGLLQHTHSIIKLALVCAEYYSLDKELLIIGALFHDVGKVYEFNISPTVDLTLEGGLLGHLVIGNTKFQELKNRIPGFPGDLSCKIQHLIVSHHGEKEFGSPEVPKIPEAFVLNILDLLDSRLKIVEENVKSAEVKGLFSEYVQVLSRRLYVPPKE